ncbi:hypothetical protein DSECCO2_414980 [anaerobic digester metagenome]
MELQTGIDVFQPRGHGLGFGLAHRGVQRLQLAVQIGQRNHVAVHNGQFTHTGAGQTFGNIAPHAAKAEQNDVGLVQPPLPCFAPKHFVAQKLIFHGFPLLS